MYDELTVPAQPCCSRCGCGPEGTQSLMRPALARPRSSGRLLRGGPRLMTGEVNEEEFLRTIKKYYAIIATDDYYY